MILAAIVRGDPWRFQAHPEIWALIAGLAAALRLRHPAHRPPGDPAGRGRRHPVPDRLVRRLPHHAVGGHRLAGARPGRGVPLQRPHGPAPAAELRRALDGPAGHADLAGPARGRPGPGLPGGEAADPLRAGDPAVQRRGGVQPLAGRRQRLRLERAAALRRARPRGRVGADHVDAGVRAAARAALPAGGPDALPVPAVGHPHRPRRLADLRRRDRVPLLRRRAPGLGRHRHRRPADRRHGDEDRRGLLPLDGDHRAVRPVRHQGRRRTTAPRARRSTAGPPCPRGEDGEVLTWQQVEQALETAPPAPRESDLPSS